jgi:hypothetical protein
MRIEFMPLRRSVLCVMTLAAAALAQGPPDLRLLGARPGRPAPLVKGAPFSADVVTETTQVLPDGNKIRQTSSERMYRDGEGRTRREPSLSSLGATGSAPQIAFVDDPVAGASYALDLTNRTVSKSSWSRAVGTRSRFFQPLDGAPRQRPADPNVKTESLGRQTIAGVPADGTRTTQTIPAGQIGNALPIQIVSERWYSPDLQMVVLSRRSDPRSGETVMQMTNIIRAEPPSTLFVPSADFQTAEPQFRMRQRQPGAPSLRRNGTADSAAH